jgi:outer membrane protein assembly factor BamB
MKKTLVIILLFLLPQKVIFAGNDKYQNCNSTISQNRLEIKNLKFKKYKSYQVTRKPIVSNYVIVNNTLFVLDFIDHLTAFDLKGMKQLWRIKLSQNKFSNERIKAGISHSEGLLYIANGSDNLIVVDALKGHEVNRKKLPGISMTQPLIYKDRAFILTIENQIVALDKKNLKLLWSIPSADNEEFNNTKSKPFVHNDNIIFSCFSDGLAMLNSNTGEPIWFYNNSNRYDVDLKNNIVTKPILDNDYFYLGTAKGELAKINLKNGNLAWKKKHKAQQSSKALQEILLVDSDGKKVLVSISSLGKIVATDTLSGKTAWHESLRIISGSKNNLLNTKEHLYVINSMGKLFKLDLRSGKLIQTTRITKNIKEFKISDSKLILFTNKSVVIYD